MMYGLGFGWLGMLFGGLIFIGLTILVIFFIVRVVQGHDRPGATYMHGEPRTDNGRALDILAERYARGEINEEEYVRMKNALKK